MFLPCNQYTFNTVNHASQAKKFSPKAFYQLYLLLNFGQQQSGLFARMLQFDILSVNISPLTHYIGRCMLCIDLELMLHY